jgi:hypothetical protein
VSFWPKEQACVLPVSIIMELAMEYEKIQTGFDVFLHDGDKAFGAVRGVSPHGRSEIVIYVENAGDFVVPFAAIHAVQADKVLLDGGKIDKALKAAIANAHRGEDPTI